MSKYEEMGRREKFESLLCGEKVNCDIKPKFKINADFLRYHSLSECYREIMVSYLPLLPMLENTVFFQEADYIIYGHPFARCEDASEYVLRELKLIDTNRKEGAEIIVVGKACNAEKLLNGSIKNITFFEDHYAEKLGKKFGFDIKDQYFVYDDVAEHLAIWPVNGCKRKCKFCRRTYMNIPFESLSLENIKMNLDYFKQNMPEKLKHISLRAENLTEYGLDIYGEQRLSDLIDMIDSYDEVETIEFPIGIAICEVTEKILESLCRCKKVVQVGLNLEAGSDRLLKLIGKDHTRDRAIHILKKIREAHPDVRIESTIMIGLPTEEFADIYELAELIGETQPDYIHCNYYVDNPRQPLSKLPQMSEQLREYHLKTLLKLLYRYLQRPLEVGYPFIYKKTRKHKRFQEKLKRENAKEYFPKYKRNMVKYVKK